MLERTDSPAWVSATVALRLLPYVLLSPFAGVLADRMDRVRLIVISDVARAALMALLAALVLFELHPALLLATATLAGCAGTPHISAFTATLPAVVEERNLPSANALVSGVEYVAVVVGPAAGAVLLLLGPDWVPFGLNAATSSSRRRCCARSVEPRAAHPVERQARAAYSPM